MDKHRNDNQGVVLPKGFIFILKILEFFHPYLGMRFAAFFFSKPFRYKMPSREAPILTKAKKNIILINDIQKRVVCYNWQGKGPKILLMHGWSGRSTNFYKIIERLMLSNYNVYAFDAPAHGESDGLITNLPEFIISQEELIKKLGPFDAILGHSGGGITSCEVCVRIPKIKKLILISPFDKMKDIFEKYFDLIDLGDKAKKLMISYFFRKTQRNIIEFSGSSLAKKINAKTLVIHDEDDREVEVLNAINIDKNIKNSSLMITKGLGHRRILRDDRVINEIIDFLNYN